MHNHNPGSITDVDRCSEACDILPECKYWVYHVDNHECIAFNSSNRTCTSITGPKYPNIEECPGELKIDNFVLKNKSDVLQLCQYDIHNISEHWPPRTTTSTVPTTAQEETTTSSGKTI